MEILNDVQIRGDEHSDTHTYTFDDDDAEDPGEGKEGGDQVCERASFFLLL